MENLTNHFFEKMNEEMKNERSSLEDKIHNWLCDQVNDIELMQAVVSEGKSIKSAVHYFFDKLAKESVKIGNNVSYAGCSDDEGYAIVREYFMSELKEVKASQLYSVQSKVKEQKNQSVDAEDSKEAEKPKKAEKKAKPKNDDLISIFDFIDEPEESDEEDGEDEESDIA